MLAAIKLKVFTSLKDKKLPTLNSSNIDYVLFENVSQIYATYFKKRQKMRIFLKKNKQFN